HPFYEGYDVGTLRLTDDHAWVAFGPKDSSYRQYAHPTLTVDANGIEVFVNVELKAAVEKLKARVAENWQGFQAIIGRLDLGEDLYIQIAERRQRQASIYDYHPVARIQVPYLKDASVGEHGFRYLRTLLEQIPLPYVTVRKRLDRLRVRMLSEKDQGQSLIAEVVRTIKAFHPLTTYINDGK
ncbi:MAG: hypothetical protein GXY55_02545, partial [Phycisphaerae bacterium]|nr:hypothetical protein [Phycisphaerae bacterium]